MFREKGHNDHASREVGRKSRKQVCTVLFINGETVIIATLLENVVCTAMSKLLVAVDNSVLRDLTNPNLPENKRADHEAFEELIELAKKRIFEIGMPFSTTAIEESHAGSEKRRLLRERIDSVLKLWPCPVLSLFRQMEIRQKSQCLQNIMQDRNGIDSRNVVISSIYTPYYLTTDYRYVRQFKAQASQIKSLCKIDVYVLTPSEFMMRYKKGKV